MKFRRGKQKEHTIEEKSVRPLTEVERAARQLQDKRAGLEKLNADLAELKGRIQNLQTERSTALRALAHGDDTQSEEISRLEGQLAGLLQKEEGFGILITEALDAIERARAEQDAAIAAEQQALKAFIAAEDAADQKALATGLPARLNKILRLYIDLQKELGGLELDGWKYKNWPSGDPFFSAVTAFGPKFDEMLQKANLEVLNFYPSALPPLFVSPCTTPIGSLGGNVHRGEILEARRRQRVAELTDQFYKDKRR